MLALPKEEPSDKLPVMLGARYLAAKLKLSGLTVILDTADEVEYSEGTSPFSFNILKA